MQPGLHRRRDSAHRTERPREPAPRPVARAVIAKRSALSPWARIGLLAVVFSSGIILAASQLGPVWSKLLFERETERQLAALEELTNAEIPARLAAWLEGHDAGLQRTVRSMASARPGVSHAAEQALLGETDRWRSLPRGSVTPRMLIMARELAAVADRLPASRRPFVRRLVERFADAPLDDQVAARELTTACDRILAKLPPPAPEELLLAQEESRAAERAKDERVARRLEDVAAPSPLEQPGLPALERDPSEIIPLDNLPPPEAGEEGTAPKTNPEKKIPKRFFAPNARELPALPVIAPENAPLLPPANDSAKKSVSQWVGELADLEVMRLLHHGDYGVRYTAERELDRRGYLSEHLPLARQLVHPDSRERRQLAERLPRLTNIDPGPWLRQLAEDEDADVRRTAAGILQASRPGRESR
jgi:hypothetical protein